VTPVVTVIPVGTRTPSATLAPAGTGTPTPATVR
jgi:hypothetical protein